MDILGTRHHICGGTWSEFSLDDDRDGLVTCNKCFKRWQRYDYKPKPPTSGSSARKPYIECPFCGEDDFDKVGLKFHLLNGYCEEFNDTCHDVWGHPLRKAGT